MLKTNFIYRKELTRKSLTNKFALSERLMFNCMVMKCNVITVTTFSPRTTTKTHKALFKYGFQAREYNLFNLFLFQLNNKENPTEQFFIVALYVFSGCYGNHRKVH